MAKSIAIALQWVNAMRLPHILLFCCFSFFIQPNGMGQTLHAFIFADDGSRDGRQLDRGEDIRNLKALMNNIATNAGLTLQLRVYTGALFNTSQLNTVLQTVNPGSQDVVFFYFNGHGGNEQADQWPSLGFNDKLYRLSSIHTALCRTNAKLVISVGDCCNNFMAGFNPFISQNRLLPNKNNLSQNYGALFKSFNGRKGIIISASSQGQVSWSGPDGAIFGISFRRSFYQAVESNTPPTWEYILGQSKNAVVQVKPQQVPQYEIREIAPASAGGGVFGMGGGGSGSSGSSGTGSKPAGPQPPTSLPQFPPAPPPNLVRISVIDNLGPNQASEWMQVDICGNRQILNLDYNTMRSQQTFFTFNNPGTCSYTLTCRTLYYYYDQWGLLRTNWVNGYGSGQVYIYPNKQYIIVGQLFGNNLILSIQEKT